AYLPACRIPTNTNYTEPNSGIRHMAFRFVGFSFQIVLILRRRNARYTHAWTFSFSRESFYRLLSSMGLWYQSCKGRIWVFWVQTGANLGFLLFSFQFV